MLVNLTQRKRLAVIGLTYLLESGWLDLCWNRVDSKDFVGIGLTLLESGWLPLLESGWLCWNWVDQAWSLVESTRFQQKRVKFVGIGLTRPLSEMGWPGSIFKSTQFQQKRVIFVGIGLTGVFWEIGWPSLFLKSTQFQQKRVKFVGIRLTSTF